MGALLNKARSDAHRILTAGGFESAIEFTAPGGSPVVTVNGTAMKHRTQFDGEDQIVNAKNAHITVSEKSLTDLAYPVRNSADEVALKGHQVKYTDSAGLTKTYTIDETFPDETIGIIPCILKDFV